MKHEDTGGSAASKLTGGYSRGSTGHRKIIGVQLAYTNLTAVPGRCGSSCGGHGSNGWPSFVVLRIDNNITGG